jgi:hypothetical protein
MKKMPMIMMLSLLMSIMFVSQVHCDPPDFNVSVNPVTIMPSYYDYMIGGYHSSNVKIVPSVWGGGFLTAYHGRQTSTSNRNCFISYIDANGIVQSTNGIGTNEAVIGYPSMDFDEQSGMILMTWHNQVPTDDFYSVYGMMGLLHDGVFTSLLYPFRIFPPQLSNITYLWPVVKFGVSPTAGMRRVYVMARRSTTNLYPIEVPFIAYADFDPGQLTYSTVLEWNYVSSPQIEAWALDTECYRRVYFTLITGIDDKIYIVGHHTAYNFATDLPQAEPRIDVWMMDNYGQGVWQRFFTNTEQPFSCQTSMSSTPMFADVSNSTHFNAVFDGDGNIHFPMLYASSTIDEGVQYYFPRLHSLRNTVFNTQTHTFRIDDLYPQGASPHADPAYTPWDINEDGVVDEIDDMGNPIFPTTWPFSYWDQSAHANAMMYHYNLQMMTESNDLGWMACVWQDSYRASLYNQTPDSYPDLSAFAGIPEIMISVSPDNGWTWLEPISLNSVDIPALTGNTPMWVYPANKIVQIAHTNNTDTGRLYLMFYHDNSWGAYSSDSPLGLNNGGDVKYMAVDFTLPYTGINEPTSVPILVSQVQNSPNPFSDNTQISFNLSKDSEVTLNIYNTKGQLVKNLAKGRSKAGKNTICWDAKDNNNNSVATGMYFYQLKIGNMTTTKKLLVCK